MEFSFVGGIYIANKQIPGKKALLTVVIQPLSKWK